MTNDPRADLVAERLDCLCPQRLDCRDPDAGKPKVFFLEMVDHSEVRMFIINSCFVLSVTTLFSFPVFYVYVPWDKNIIFFHSSCELRGRVAGDIGIKWGLL